MNDGLFANILILVVIALYFLPSVIAGSRKHLNAASIFVVNLFFGWTLIGWVGCLAWSMSSNVKPNVPAT